jgi:hypothetical protein
MLLELGDISLYPFGESISGPCRRTTAHSDTKFSKDSLDGLQIPEVSSEKMNEA